MISNAVFGPVSAAGRRPRRRPPSSESSRNRSARPLWCPARLPRRNKLPAPPGTAADLTMAENIVPHFHNTPGVPVIEIGAKEFQCVGATPPFDHPLVFLDMGDANEIICPYCSK